MLRHSRDGTRVLGAPKLRSLLRLAVFSAFVLLAGCHRGRPLTQAEQFAVALNQFYRKEPACLWQQKTSLDAINYGAYLPTPTEANALVSAGLIAAAPPRGYKLTDAGQKVWHPNLDQPRFGNFCYGTWHVDHIETMTPRHDETYGDVVDAQFFVVIASPAAWTRTPGMQQAFPLMGLEVNGPLPHVATLKKAGKEWHVASAVIDTAFP